MRERRRPGRTVQTLDEAERARLAELRAGAVNAWTTIVTNGPDDPLGALAWLVGLIGPTPYDPTAMAAAIDRARAAGFTWRQIADALGEGNTLEVSRRVMDRRLRWG
jgi:alkylhydroperoxidase family enzyme